METAELLHLFSTVLFWAVFVSLFINWRNKPLFLLSLIVFLSWVTGKLLFNTIYNWGNAYLSWNISWVIVQLPFYLMVYLKLNSRLYSPKDISIMLLMLLYIASQFMQFLDWNYNNDSFMREAKTYVIPIINTLMVATLLKDGFFRSIELLSKLGKKVVEKSISLTGKNAKLNNL